MGHSEQKVCERKGQGQGTSSKFRISGVGTIGPVLGRKWEYVIGGQGKERSEKNTKGEGGGKK